MDDTWDTPRRWYYLADCGRWHQVEDDLENPFSSLELEQYFLENSKIRLSKHSSGGQYQVDFSAMVQSDLTRRKQRKLKRGFNIERRCVCYLDPPVLWENFDPDSPYQLIPLSELTPEYKTVAEYVNKEGAFRHNIVSISRIQNLDLWEIFCRKRRQLMRLHRVEHIEEKRLFHGTDNSNIEAICKYNFDLRVAGKKGSAYGKGIYFSKHASYAAQYSLRTGEARIILARVLVGKSTLGHHDLLKPDGGSLENEHDSCVDDITHPKIFVVFDPNQIYPEYVIQYKY